MTALLLLSVSAVFVDPLSTCAATVPYVGTGRLTERGLPEVENEGDTAAVVVTREDSSGWADVPLEGEAGDDFDWRSIVGNAEEREQEREPFRPSTEFPEDPPVAELYPRNKVVSAGISLEGQGKKKDATLEQTKRVAAAFVLAIPSKKQLMLEEKGVLVGKELDRYEKQKERRKKRREKLEFERLKRQQRQRYDSAVDLVEQKVAKKNQAFKALRGILRYLQKLSEGIS